MEDDFFLKHMKGVKPINKEKNISKQKTKTKNIKNNPLKKHPTDIIKSTNPNYKISFGEINKDLKRGKIKIDRRVDLHGYSLLDAHEKFKKEVIKTYNNNKRCILVITGKGVHLNNSNQEKPRLFYGKIKNSIISWINEDDLKNYILTFQDASSEHGGDGALFVYLRKKKN